MVELSSRSEHVVDKILWKPRVLVSAFLLALALLLLLAAPTIAILTTTGTATFSAITPGPNSQVQVTNPVLSVDVSNPVGLYSSVTMRLDGRLLRARLAYVFLPDGGLAYRVTAPTSGLAEGAHTAYLSVLDFSGRRSTATWVFQVQIPPRLSDPQPAPGVTIANRTPTLSVRTASAGTQPLVTMMLDGLVLSATYDPTSGLVSARPETPLANDREYTVFAAVTKENGLSATLSWTFRIQVYPQMPELACETCHTGYPAPRHSTDNCDPCHGSPSPVMDCANCHGWAQHSPEYLTRPGWECTSCHNPQWSATIPMHLMDTETYHQTSSAMGECRSCHVSSLTVEHFRRADDEGVSLDCLSCHLSEDPSVRAAIASADTRCETCHGSVTPDHGYSVSLHTADTSGLSFSGTYSSGGSWGPFTCSTCHQLELSPEHTRASSSSATRGCDNCHPSPRDSLTSWDATCAAGECHAAGSSTEAHSSLDSAHVLPPNRAACAEAGCHTAGDLRSIHEDAGSGPTTGCRVCHSAAVVPASADCATSDCHPEKVDETDGVVSHGFDPMKHTSTIDTQSSTIAISGTSYGPHSCSECHATELATEHNKATSTSAGQSCATCHPTPRSSFVAWSKGCQQGDCHTLTSEALQHADIDQAHSRLAGNDICAASGCHPLDLAGIHTGAGTQVGATTVTSCGVCHASGVPSAKDCFVCHPEKVDGGGNVVSHGFSEAKHTATVGALTISGSLPYPIVWGVDNTFGGQRCDACHGMLLTTEHGKPTSISSGGGCTACHPSPRNSFVEWNYTCQQSGCHPAYHTDMATKHRDIEVGCDQDDPYGCHPEWRYELLGDVAAIHNDRPKAAASGHDGCYWCHTSPAGVPATTGCYDCHPIPGSGLHY